MKRKEENDSNERNDNEAMIINKYNGNETMKWKWW